MLVSTSALLLGDEKEYFVHASGLKNGIGIENLKLLELNNGNKNIEWPIIVYRNEKKNTRIIVEYDNKTLIEKDAYTKELDIDFF